MPETNSGPDVRFRVTAVRPETDMVKTLLLEPAGGGPFHFEAGQFLTLILSINGRKIRRSYSLSGVPGEPFSITIKRYPNGWASRWLYEQARPGLVLNGDGPHGLFTRSKLPPDTQQLFLYAAGVGITPVYSLLKDVLRHTALYANLLYSNRAAGEAVFREELNALLETYPGRFHLRSFYSDDPRLDRARITNSNLPGILVEDLLQVPLDHTAHYICGPLPYQFSIRSALAGMGVPQDRIRTENFDPAPRPASVPVPETVPREVTIELPTGMRRFNVNPPETLLQAARTAGLSLPYSCESGRCGACALHCTTGAVWMSNNEVLTNADLKAGLVLTCTGHPVGDGVRLRLK